MLMLESDYLPGQGRVGSRSCLTSYPATKFRNFFEEAFPSWRTLSIPYRFQRGCEAAGLSVSPTRSEAERGESACERLKPAKLAT